MVVASFAGCDHVTVVALLCVAVALVGLIASSLLTNYLDLAPNFAGSMMGVSNTVMTVAGIVAPLVTGAIVTGQSHGSHESVTTRHRSLIGRRSVTRVTRVRHNTSQVTHRSQVSHTGHRSVTWVTGQSQHVTGHS